MRSRWPRKSYMNDHTRPRSVITSLCDVRIGGFFHRTGPLHLIFEAEMDPKRRKVYSTSLGIQFMACIYRTGSQSTSYDCQPLHLEIHVTKTLQLHPLISCSIAPIFFAECLSHAYSAAFRPILSLSFGSEMSWLILSNIASSDPV